MWANAAKSVAKYSEGVITTLGEHGYPVSVRQTTLPYDAATGTMRITIPESVEAVEGPACLLCHSHDDKLAKITMIQLHGRIEKRADEWLFVTTSFSAPSMWQLMKSTRASTKKYLTERGLTGQAAPVVDYEVIARLWERAQASKR